MQIADYIVSLWRSNKKTWWKLSNETRNIELLLDYCMRFYERQFITRNQANKDIVVKFEQLLDEYFQNQVAMTEGLPSVKYFADKACLSLISI